MTTNSLPKWFWAAAIIALIWNLMGLAAFYMQMTMSPEALAALPQEQQDLYAVLPTWVKIAFGVAVIGGVLASIALVMRRNWAFPLFVISLLGVIAQQSYMHFMSNTFEVMGEGSMIMPSLVLLIAIALCWFSHRASMRGWLT